MSRDLDSRKPGASGPRGLILIGLAYVAVAIAHVVLGALGMVSEPELALILGSATGGLLVAGTGVFMAFRRRAL